MSAAASRMSDDPKREATAALARAQADLERVVAEIERLPALDTHSIALAAHALTSFLSVTGAVVDHLIPMLRGHPDPQIGVWLDGLAHATALMSHTVSQLMNGAVGVATTLRLDDVELPRLVERACAYYRRIAGQNAVELRFAAGVDVPLLRTDRVLVAAVVDTLLSNAIQRAPAATHVSVEVWSERAGAVCRVRDGGRATAPSTGYGLAVAKRFVDLLGGEIVCESAAPGIATSVWLPRTRATG